jgi:hypothetical protein
MASIQQRPGDWICQVEFVFLILFFSHVAFLILKEELFVLSAVCLMVVLELE